MNSLIAIAALAGLLVLVLIALAVIFRERRRLQRRVASLNDELIAVSDDALVGRRLSEKDPGDIGDLARTINRLFDAIGERDEEIHDRDKLFGDFARTLPEIVLIHDERILLANESAANLVGLSPAQLEGRDAADLVKPAYRALFRRTMAKHLAGESAPQRLEIQMINGDEAGLWVEAQSAAIEYLGKQVMLTIARDVSYRKSLEVSLSRSKRQAQYTLESISEGIITTDNEGRIDYMNQAAESMTGVTRDDASGHKTGELFALIDEADRRALGDPVERCLSVRRRVNMGRRALLVSRDGKHEHSVELTASPIKGPGSSISGTVIVFHDVSEIRGITRQMSYQAAHDALTGLINRREFERRLGEALDTAHAEEVVHILFYMDLDRFKAVNDSCGHTAGDSMLREVAALIKGEVRDSDFVARLGGDEFGTLLIGCPLEKAQQIATDICNAVADYRFVWQDKIFNIGISIGIVEVTHNSGSLQDVINAADSACYVAKDRGRNQIHVSRIDDSAIKIRHTEMLWVERINRALHENRFRLFKQPIRPLQKKDAPQYHELLLRLVDVEGRIVAPSQFITAAERYRMMPVIDLWVVGAALSSIGAIAEPTTGISAAFTINLSGQSFGNAELKELILGQLDRLQIPPRRVMFEITETAAISNLSHALDFMTALRDRGCRFILDDFGSGLSSFRYLKSLDIEFLKIDGELVREIATDPIQREMVAAIHRIGESMGIQTIGEWVENSEIEQTLIEIGVDYAQGWEVGRPEPFVE